jgi:hypothetical protein
MHIPPVDGNFETERKAIKPVIIEDYNTHMGYVDLSDRMANSYNICRRTWKWTKKLFFHLLDLTILNAHIACCVFASGSLATASLSGDPSASHSQVLLSLTLIQNCLPAIPSTELDHLLFSASIAELNCMTQLSTQLAWVPCYRALGQTQKKTRFPTILVLLLAYSFSNMFIKLLPSGGCLHCSSLRVSCHSIVSHETVCLTCRI